ncbi:hypothetical protein AOLI_G00264870 [Acnodon oligacanthus]
MEEEKRKQLWKEHLQHLGQSECSSRSVENLRSDRIQENQDLQQETQNKQNQALQMAAETARQREENRKAEEAEVERELLRRREEEAKRPKTAAEKLMKFVRKTCQRVVDYTSQNDLHSPYHQHRLQLKMLKQELEKTEKELLEKRRKAKKAQ